jgi:RimJ/RimL family protein N-acetyltransferase
MILTDNTIMLRRFKPTDAEAVFEAVQESVSHLYPWFDWVSDEYTLAETHTWLEGQAVTWEAKQIYSFAITDTKTDQFLGACFLNHLNWKDRFANVAYWIRYGAIGRGVAPAATLLLARYGFEELKLNRLEIIMAESNKASLRVAEKVGATREGFLRRRIVVRETIYDAFLYSLIPEDLT